MKTWELIRPTVHLFYQSLFQKMKEEHNWFNRLDKETDTTYFDDFESVDDMKLYQDVLKKRNEQKIVRDSGMEAYSTRKLRESFVGFTFKQKDHDDASFMSE